MWTYLDKEFTQTEAESYFGFVYLITHIPTNRKYVGKKFFTKAGTKQVNGKKKKIRKVSDWESYWSSSEMLQEEVKHSVDKLQLTNIQIYTYREMQLGQEVFIYQRYMDYI